MKKNKAMAEEELVALLRRGIQEAVNYDNTNLSRERREHLDYYDGTLPKPLHKGDSKYVSQDVYDAVETLKAQLVEVFTGNRKPVRFAPEGDDDFQQALYATTAVTTTIQRLNPFYDISLDVIHDGLMNRNGIVKTYWDANEETVADDYENLTEDELDAILAEPDVVDLESISLNDDETAFDATVIRQTSKQQVRIAPTPSEEFLISPNAKCLDTAELLAHRMKTTRSDLRKEGYPEHLINKIGGGDEWSREDEPEYAERHKETSDLSDEFDESGQDALAPVTLYEVYRKIDMDGSGVARYWKITMAGQVILDKEETDGHPFIDFAPLRSPHRFWGNAFVKKVIPTQNARTYLTRSIINHALITNNPRWQVTKGGLVNFKEMTDNRLGGIVNVTRPDALSALPQPGLNPFVFQTISMLDEDKEETTGISRLSQGLNKDAISKQNSKDMVDSLVSNSQQRQKIMARNFAEFLRKLYLRVYKLLIENADEEMMLEIAGEYIPVNPSSWSTRKDLIVEFTLGGGEIEKEAEKYQQLYQLLASDPAMVERFGPEQREALADEISERLGIPELGRFLIPVEEMPEPKPDPAQEMAMQAQMKELELRERQQALTERKQMAEEQRMANEHELEVMKLRSKIALDTDDQELAERQQDHKEHVDNEELRVLSTTEDKRGIVSPTG
ncbi:portal protein [Pyruvatibacter sp.]